MSISYRIMFDPSTDLKPENIRSHGYEIADGHLLFLNQAGGVIGAYPVGDVLAVEARMDARPEPEPEPMPTSKSPTIEYVPRWGDEPVRGADSCLPQLHRIFTNDGQVFEIRPKYVEHDPHGQMGVSLFHPQPKGFMSTEAAPGAQLNVPKQHGVMVARSDIDRVEIIEDFDAIMPDGSNHRTGHLPTLEPTQHRIGLPSGWGHLEHPPWYFEHIAQPGYVLVVSDGYGISNPARYLVRDPASGRGDWPEVVFWESGMRFDYASVRDIEYASLVPKPDGQPPSSKLPRCFKLVRHGDVSGPSGVGEVAEGVLFSDGVAAVRWTTEWPTTVVHHDRGIESVHKLHGHNGNTDIVWTDTGEVYTPPPMPALAGSFEGVAASEEAPDPPEPPAEWGMGQERPDAG